MDATTAPEPTTLEEALKLIARLRFEVAKYKAVARSQERKYVEAARELDAVRSDEQR